MALRFVSAIRCGRGASRRCLDRRDFSCEHPYEGLFGGALRVFAALPDFAAHALICR
jgi:hypothetical protein